MKRSLLIAVLVLVPFGGLIAFGFSLLKDPAPLAIPEPRPLPPPPQVHVAPVPIGGVVRKALDVSVPVRAPQQQPTTLAGAIGEPEPPPLPPAPARDPLVVAVEPLVNQCFKDIADRVKEPMRVTVSFDVGPGGAYAGVAIKKVSWPDPHLEACIVDAFEDAKFEPPVQPMKRQTRTFTFGYADAGR